LAEFGPTAVAKLGLWKPRESINLATPDRNYELKKKKQLFIEFVSLI